RLFLIGPRRRGRPQRTGSVRTGRGLCALVGHRTHCRLRRGGAKVPPRTHDHPETEVAPGTRNTRTISAVRNGMRVVGVTEFGGPEALHTTEIAEPTAGPGQIRLRVFAAAVNPTDTYVRN